jgi:hypothetical protein
MGEDVSLVKFKADHGRASSAPPLGALGCSEVGGGLPVSAALAALAGKLSPGG